MCAGEVAVLVAASSICKLRYSHRRSSMALQLKCIVGLTVFKLLQYEVDGKEGNSAFIEHFLFEGSHCAKPFLLIRPNQRLDAFVSRFVGSMFCGAREHIARDYLKLENIVWGCFPLNHHHSYLNRTNERRH